MMITLLFLDVASSQALSGKRKVETAGMQAGTSVHEAFELAELGERIEIMITSVEVRMMWVDSRYLGSYLTGLMQ